MNDGTTLERWVGQRDAEAFQELVGAYSGMVYGACLRVLGNTAEAEDVSQECFAALSQVKRAPAGYLGPWLHRVATNLSLKRLRSDLRRKKRESEFAEAYLAQRDIEWDDVCEYVDEAIDELPEKLRIPVVAHFLDAQSHAAIAKSFHIPRETITSRMHRGVEEIRKSLRRKGIPVAAPALFSMLGANMRMGPRRLRICPSNAMLIPAAPPIRYRRFWPGRSPYGVFERLSCRS